MKLLSIFALSAVLLFTACNDKSENPIPSYSINFTPNSTINMQNPDRGFYDADYELTQKTDKNMFQKPKEEGYNLVYGVIYLAEYVETDMLPSDLIENINNNLNDAEELSMKIILRIKYRNSSDSDPRKEIAQSHLSQLKETLQNHKNIISIVQAGVIGRWGEWHGFTGDYDYDNSDYKDNRRDIISTLIDIFPNKYIQIRYPMAKELLYGSAEEKNDIADDGIITKDIAYTDDIRAKLGHHNDCFLASETDMGTYSNDDGPEGIEFWREYVINDTKYSPVGGETCVDNDLYTNCENALKEFKLFQWSYLNEAYDLDVIQRFKDEGCYEEIKENLGYRLEAQELVIQKDKNNLIASLHIKNQGFASPYIKSDVSFILQDVNNTYEYPQEEDLRTFYPNETSQIKHVFDVEKIKAGEYCLYLKIGEDFSSIRLANSDTWDENSSTNLLTCSIIME